MTLYRGDLPQLSGELFLTDGGLETYLIFSKGIELPYFAAFDLLSTAGGQDAVRSFYEGFALLARRYQTGLILETPTWRASHDWGQKIGYSAEALAQANRTAIDLLSRLRAEHESPDTPIVLSGCIGPQGDGYHPDPSLSSAQAEAYHRVQIETFASTEADMIGAFTLGCAAEAIGIARAARAAAMPVAISFTVETDGTLPSGETLKSAIESVDAETSGYPMYFGVNCAHPSHFAQALDADELWVKRVRQIKANASCKSHSELNESSSLDTGDPVDFGARYAALRSRLPDINIMAGCCGTDTRHLEQAVLACRLHL